MHPNRNAEDLNAMKMCTWFSIVVLLVMLCVPYCTMVSHCSPVLPLSVGLEGESSSGSMVERGPNAPEVNLGWEIHFLVSVDECLFIHIWVLCVGRGGEGRGEMRVTVMAEVRWRIRFVSAESSKSTHHIHIVCLCVRVCMGGGSVFE